MKAITLQQPYATLIMLGVKRFETRPSPPNGNMRPDGVRGLSGLSINAGERIVIHAGMTVDRRHFPKLRARKQNNGWHLEDRRTPSLIGNIHLPLGALLGTVEVVRALPISGPVIAQDHIGISEYVLGDRYVEFETLIEVRTDVNLFDSGPFSWKHTSTDISDQMPFGDWQPGRWAWELTDVDVLREPIPAKGKQGVWEVDL